MAIGDIRYGTEAMKEKDVVNHSVDVIITSVFQKSTDQTKRVDTVLGCD